MNQWGIYGEGPETASTGPKQGQMLNLVSIVNNNEAS